MRIKFTAVDLRGNEHTIRRCTAKDILKHFSIVKHLIPESDRKSYINKMKVCKRSGMAFCIGNDCFFYAQYSGKQSIEAFSLYGKGEPLKTLAMFSHILLTLDKKLVLLRFSPHAGLKVDDFKSLLTRIAIKRQFASGKPVLVRCDTLRQKLLALYKNRGIPWETL
jgi:hypothetical protein|tara:strand:+ start:251 stop:748 length:498 start_codon:yes stop_codon:yes gene_type:complete